MTAAFALSPRIDCAGLPASARVGASGVEGRLQQDELWEVLLARANDGDGSPTNPSWNKIAPALEAVFNDVPDRNEIHIRMPGLPQFDFIIVAIKNGLRTFTT